VRRCLDRGGIVEVEARGVGEIPARQEARDRALKAILAGLQLCFGERGESSPRHEVGNRNRGYVHDFRYTAFFHITAIIYSQIIGMFQRFC
jgi:hypothetical protein